MKLKIFDQVGVGGRRVRIWSGECFPVLQTHLSHVFERARDHDPRIREVKALAKYTRKIQDLGYDGMIIAPRQVVGYVVT